MMNSTPSGLHPLFRLRTMDVTMAIGIENLRFSACTRDVTMSIGIENLRFSC
jgi:hypothetical protein